MAKIKTHDFLEIEYTGKTKEDDFVFDTTEEKVAKENTIWQQGTVYKPVTICVGEQQILPGIDESLEGREIGESYSIELGPEKAFGKKNAKLLQMVSQRMFKKQDVMPQVGLQVQIDGRMGIIRSASGGRVIVDFNNPLSGKDVVYDIKINKAVTDIKEKVMSLLAQVFPEAEVTVKDKVVEIKNKFAVPDEIIKPYSDKIKEVISEIKEIKFVEDKPKKETKSAKPKKETTEK